VWPCVRPFFALRQDRRYIFVIGAGVADD